MPNDTLSQVTIRYLWKGRYVDDPQKLIAYQEAGYALNNTSQGMQYQLWVFTAEGKSVYVEASNTGGRIHLFDVSSNIDEVVGCFDQNMNYFVAYSMVGQWHYSWFDTQTSSRIVSDLPVGVTSCQCTLDDKRSIEVNGSDILLFYTLNNNLYQRRQRDRYQNQLLLRAGISGVLVKVNMNGLNRLQFKLRVV